MDEAERLGSVSGSDPDDCLVDGAIYALQNRDRLLAEDAARRARLKAIGALPDGVPLEEMPPE